jgi:hypothetical protein
MNLSLDLHLQSTSQLFPWRVGRAKGARKWALSLERESEGFWGERRLERKGRGRRGQQSVLGNNLQNNIPRPLACGIDAG